MESRRPGFGRSASAPEAADGPGSPLEWSSPFALHERGETGDVLVLSRQATRKVPCIAAGVVRRHLDATLPMGAGLKRLTVSRRNGSIRFLAARVRIARQISAEGGPAC